LTAILGGRDVDGVRKGVITLHFRVMSKYRQFSSQSTRATDGRTGGQTDGQTEFRPPYVRRCMRRAVYIRLHFGTGQVFLADVFSSGSLAECL